MIATEFAYRLEIGHALADQPHQLSVAARFTLQPPARLRFVQIAIDIDVEQHRWMVVGPPGRSCTGETQRSQIQFVNESIDDPTGRPRLRDRPRNQVGRTADADRNPL